MWTPHNPQVSAWSVPSLLSNFISYRVLSLLITFQQHRSSFTSNFYPAQRLCTYLPFAWNPSPCYTFSIYPCKVGFFRSQVKNHIFTPSKEAFHFPFLQHPMPSYSSFTLQWFCLFLCWQSVPQTNVSFIKNWGHTSLTYQLHPQTLAHCWACSRHQ